MNKRRLFAATNVCLGAFPPIVGFYGVWDAVASLLPQDPPKAFLLGFAIGFSFAVPGIIFAISTSAGEQ